MRPRRSPTPSRLPLLALLVLVLVSSCCLGVAVVAAAEADATAKASTTTSVQTKDYDILSVIEEGGSSVVVARRNSVLFLLYDETIIGAEFDHPELRLQAAYPGFAIMQAAAYLDRRFARAAQIGLGIGTVPSFLRAQGIPTDVIEISDAVVRQASDFFQFERCESRTRSTDSGDDNDDEEERDDSSAHECPRGETFVADGLAFLQQEPPTPAPYDLFIIDVYTGWNPVAFYVQEVMARVRDAWLRAPAGVLVVNFVGHFRGEHAAVPKSIFRTLQSVFTHVKSFREMDNIGDDDASNIVFFASNEPFAFNVPTDGPYHEPDYNTYYYIVANFPKWEIFTDLKRDASVEVVVQQSADADDVTFETTVRASPSDASLVGAAAVSTSAHAHVLTQQRHGQREFARTHAFTQEHMRARVVAQFPPAFWADIKTLAGRGSGAESVGDAASD